jgi:hypothetical protein
MLNLRCVREGNATLNYERTSGILLETITRMQIGHDVRPQIIEACDGEPLPPLWDYQN